MAIVPLSVVIPAHNRVQPLLVTLERILHCDPGPSEILVHVDGANSATLEAVAKQFPLVRLLSSPANLGPGGARDCLIRKASHEWVATFDDDSYTEDASYFARVIADIASHPHTAVFTSDFTAPELRDMPLQQVAVFSGCGCVYNRSWYLRTRGYVPRVVAYGFEEVDLSLQLHALGGQILLDPKLNVIHDHPITGRFPEEIVTETILNAFLFPWVRYPFLMLPLGLIQAMRYALHAALTGEQSALLKAIQQLPSTLMRYQSLRAPVSSSAVWTWLRLRRSIISLRAVGNG